MKKSILFLLGLIFFSNLIYAQDCKYEKNDVDKFTNQKLLLTEPLQICDKIKNNSVKVKKVQIQTKLENNQRILHLIISFKAGMMVMAGTEKLICILANGDKVELKLMSPMASYNAKYTSLDYIYSYKIDEINFDELINKNIKDVRVEAYMNSFDFTVNECVSTTNIFKCIK